MGFDIYDSMMVVREFIGISRNICEPDPSEAIVSTLDMSNDNWGWTYLGTPWYP